ncbi:MAG TPA: hypothetical protein VGY55_11290, partial [Pirellulales bacterium]|nr:hypothetical protein [Pirellulales bacterium]
MQRPIRFVLTCLIAIGLSGGESCVCGSSVSGKNQQQCAKQAPGKHVPGQCRCGMKGGVCHCGAGCCCQNSAPDKTVPINQNNRGNST